VTGVADLLDGRRIVPVVTIDDADDAVPVARALHDGGIDVVEITLRTAAGLDAIGRIAAELPDVLVGAGSVKSTDDLAAAADAGARFVVSPGFDRELVDEARYIGLPMLPGIATATELQTASNAGVDVVKLFPAEIVGGISLVGALSAVWPGVRFVPTGGITPQNAGAYLALPSVAAVGGSWMVPAGAVARRDWTAVTERAADAVRLAGGER
jgi:2-dehydro-3-deoxyphosphogluconate aldolase/(4S)-4-hydroxy-2-oxoglutarate aldolase